METPTPYLEKHILVCTDESSCGMQDAEELRDALKQALRDRNLRVRFRDGACSCVGLCGKGVNAVIWPEGTWLAGLTIDDIPRLCNYLAGTGPRLTDLEELAKAKIALKQMSQGR